MLWKTALAIDAGIAAAMAIVTSAFNSDHPNYVCCYHVLGFFFQFLNIKYLAIILVIRKLFKITLGRKIKYFGQEKINFAKKRRRKEHSISFHQVEA